MHGNSLIDFKVSCLFEAKYYEQNARFDFHMGPLELHPVFMIIFELRVVIELEDYSLVPSNS